MMDARAPLTREGGETSSCQFIFTMGFCLCGAILNLKAFCFGAIPDIKIKCIIYGSVPQSMQSYLLQMVNPALIEIPFGHLS
jgi:hypothetical protein